MADRMQDVFPIVFNFKRGEQPSSEKLTKWVQLEDIGFDKITLAVGDPWDYQTHTTSGGSSYKLSPEFLSQPSIARMIGPSDYISTTGSFNESRGSTLAATLIANKNCWNLGIPLVKVSSSSPVTPSSTSAVGNGISALTSIDLTFSDTTTFSTYQSSPSDVTTAGDYHVDFYRGTIISYSVPSSNVTLTISSDLHIFGAGSPWGTPNVIPTWNDSSTGCTVTLLTDNGDGTYTYSIDLPSIVNYPRTNAATNARAVGSSAGLSSNQVQYPASSVLSAGSSYRLPYSLISNLTLGDTVPSGYCFLWDNDSEVIIPSSTFAYQTGYQLTITCPQLTQIGTTPGDSSNTAYRLVVNGASLAEQVNWLMRAYRDTWHDGLTWGGTVSSALNYSAPLSHDNTYDRYSWSDVSGATISTTNQPRLRFTESSYPTNCHPQYLHRYGYMSGETTGNTNNAMRGDLLFASTVDHSFSLSVAWETYGIKFGAPSGGSSISFIAGSQLSTWTTDVPLPKADRCPIGLDNTGANEVYETRGGVVAYKPYLHIPFYLRGCDWVDSAPDDVRGAVLGFELKDYLEGNYIKLMPVNRDGTYDVRHLPAETGQSATDAPTNMPALNPNTETGGTLPAGVQCRISADQLREFRFRGVSYVPSSNNPDDSLGGENIRGLGNDIDEFKSYFTSPGVVGADFINVYSNAIFFSDQGDGKVTSLNENGEAWLNTGTSTSIPTGLYFLPEGKSISEPKFRFSVWDGSASTAPFSFGDTAGFTYYGRGNVSLTSSTGNVSLASSTAISAVSYGTIGVSAASNISIASGAGTVDIDGTTVDIDATTVDITSGSAMTLTGGTTLTINSALDANITSSFGDLSLYAPSGNWFGEGAQVTLTSSGTTFSIYGETNIRLLPRQGGTGYLYLYNIPDGSVGAGSVYSGRVWRDSSGYLHLTA